MDPGNSSVAVLPAGGSFNVYLNAEPNQNWNLPATFSQGELIATFKSTPGTSTAAGSVSLVTQTYVLEWSRDFVFKGRVHNLARSIRYGFTNISFASNIPLSGPMFPQVTFAGAGSAIAISKPMSGECF